MFITQNISKIKGLRKEDIIHLNPQPWELWTIEEVRSIRPIIQGSELGEYISSKIYTSTEDQLILDLINFINSKRFFGYEIDGEKLFLAIPSERNFGNSLNSFNQRLLKLAFSYIDFLDSDDKQNAKEEFLRLHHHLKLEIAKRLFSKNFKLKFCLQFKGITGVALTGNVGFDKIMLPMDLCEKLDIVVGDYVLVLRDPIQYLFCYMQVVGFTSSEIRINALSIQLIDGDFDGDRLQVIPINSICAQMIEQNISLERIEELRLSLLDLLPSSLAKKYNHHKKYNILGGK